nr:MAG TPA: Replicative helicase [Caudoviricetes sp.]
MEAMGDILEKIQNMKKSTTHTSSTAAPKYECEKCHDVGFIIDKENNRAVQCECMLVKRYKEILKKSGISEEFRNMTFENYKTNRKPKIIIGAKKAAMEYVEGFEEFKNERRNSIAFLGQVGSGKTHLTMAIANALMEKRIAVLYMQYREEIPKLKQNMLDTEYYQNQLSKFKEAPVLLVDDLFKGKITDSDRNIMFEIINHRYFKCLPIIVSSEYKINDLVYYDEAIGSRIVEMCKGKIIQFEGKELNYRLRG